jgi:hypothetical protein
MVTRKKQVKVTVKTLKESLIIDTKLYINKFHECLKSGQYENEKMIFLNPHGVSIRLRDIKDFFNKQMIRTRVTSDVKDNIRASRLSAVDYEDIIIRYYPYIFMYTPEYYESKYSSLMYMVKTGHSTLFNALAKLYMWFVQNSSEGMIYYDCPSDLPYPMPHIGCDHGCLARLCTESSISELFVAILVFGQHIPTLCRYSDKDGNNPIITYWSIDPFKIKPLNKPLKIKEHVDAEEDDSDSEDEDDSNDDSDSEDDDDDEEDDYEYDEGYIDHDDRDDKPYDDFEEEMEDYKRS